MDISKACCPGCSRPMTLVRARCDACGIGLDGSLEVSALARLSLEDQEMVVAFLRHHGSIKQMERLFGISYPTVKNRLARITRQLDDEEREPRKGAR
jgi:hypothetical protein